MSSKWKFQVHLDSFEIHVAYLPGNRTAKLTWFFQACHDVSRTFANFDMLPYKSFVRWGVQGVLSLRGFFGPGPRTSLHGRSGIGLRRLAGAKGSRQRNSSRCKPNLISLAPSWSKPFYPWFQQIIEKDTDALSVSVSAYLESTQPSEQTVRTIVWRSSRRISQRRFEWSAWKVREEGEEVTTSRHIVAVWHWIRSHSQVLRRKAKQIGKRQCGNANLWDCFCNLGVECIQSLSDIWEVMEGYRSYTDRIRWVGKVPFSNFLVILLSHFEVPQFLLSFNLSFASDTLVIFSESLFF